MVLSSLLIHVNNIRIFVPMGIDSHILERNFYHWIADRISRITSAFVCPPQSILGKNKI